MSYFKEKHKEYLVKSGIKSEDDLAIYLDILRYSRNSPKEDRQMLMDFAWLLINDKTSVSSFFAENKNPSKEFYNAFVKHTESEEKVRANFYRKDNSTVTICMNFISLEEAKEYFKHSINTEAFYYVYGTDELIEKEEKSSNSPTFMDEVLDSNTTVTEVPNFNLIDIEQILPKHVFDTIEKQEDKKEGFNSSDSPLADEIGYFKQCGKKEIKGKLFYELDFEFIKQMAERMQSNKDNSKYELWNWKKPLSEKDLEELKQAMWRHIIAVMSGELEDDGRPFGHLEAISNNAMMINYQLKLNKC